jgi:hypothetical protein
MRDPGRRWSLAAGALLVLVVAAAIGIYAGLYNIAADVPHTRPWHPSSGLLRPYLVISPLRGV